MPALHIQAFLERSRTHTGSHDDHSPCESGLVPDCMSYQSGILDKQPCGFWLGVRQRCLGLDLAGMLVFVVLMTTFPLVGAEMFRKV